MSKVFSETYAVLREDVRSFIVNFWQNVKNQNVVEIENDCQIKFPKLTEQYFMSSRWPSAEVIGGLVDHDHIFLMLYNEMYYQHVYAHLSSSLTVDDMVQSFSNYCALFNAIIKAEKPIPLSLPNQWLWGIVDEFIYQFQKFCIFRNRPKHKPEDEALLVKNQRIWNIHSVLNVLHSLISRSSINEQLSYYARRGDPDEIADEFGRCVLYKMLGFFSLVGLCRLHCLLGDYYTSIKVLENINFNRLEMYHEVPTCHITTGYFVGFDFMMMQRYDDAIRILSSTLAYKSRAISLIAQRPDQREYVTKQADQMLCLLSICWTMTESSYDRNLDADRRDKYPDTLINLQQLDPAEFVSAFDLGSPRFISPETLNYGKQLSNQSTTLDEIVTSLEPQRQQIELFKCEINQQIQWLRIKSFLKFYTNLPISKLAAYVNCSEFKLNMSLMAYKYRLKQDITSDSNQLGMGSLSGFANVNHGELGIGSGMLSTQQQQQQMFNDLDFYIVGDTIYTADTTVDRRFSEYFIHHIELLQQMNKILDTLERRVHEASVQEMNQEQASSLST